MTLTVAIGIGMILGLIFYELVGLSPGGMIVPGYIALFLDQPERLLGTAVISILTWLIMRYLSKYLILFSRRRFVLTVLVGFILARVSEVFILGLIGTLELRTIGYVIPGLIANDMEQQGVWPTLGSVVIVSILAGLIIHLLVIPWNLRI
ncbi:MAG: poly-gamma-glutamate biosynthesis protein PgsC [Candidatus Binatia bacterium]